jgi:hypothetical protein
MPVPVFVSTCPSAHFGTHGLEGGRKKPWY